MAHVDPKLRDLVRADSLDFAGVPGHPPDYPDSFKDRTYKQAGFQTSFSRDGHRMDGDSDIWNIAFNGTKAEKVEVFLGHTGEVIRNHFFGPTNPYIIWRILDERNITPHYNLK